MPDVVVKSGHVRPVWAGHPWVFAQGIDSVTGQVAAGDEVRVLDPKGQVLGRGLYSPNSAIPVRLYTRDGEQTLDVELLRHRLEQALARRRAWNLPNDATNAFRVLNAEGDELPGLIVDRLGDTVLLQFSTLGMKQRESQIVEALRQVLDPKAIVDRTPPGAAKLEGFAPGSGLLHGSSLPSQLEFMENSLRFEIPLSLGQKTGYYLDLRALRARLSRLARGQRVLDCYAYVGATGLAMARGGADRVVSVESSQAAVDVGKRCIELNGLSGTMRIEKASADRALADAATQGGFDLVVCDPPKLMPQRSAFSRAQRAMQKIARAAVAATRPGGLLALCSCSAGLGIDELSRALAIGATRAGRSAILLERVYQDIDHPVPAAFPEGLYLSALIAELPRRR